MLKIEIKTTAEIHTVTTTSNLTIIAKYKAGQRLNGSLLRHTKTKRPQTAKIKSENLQEIEMASSKITATLFSSDIIIAMMSSSTFDFVGKVM